MKAEIVHLILSFMVGGVVFWYFRKWRVFAWALIGGFLVDFDHLIDYFLWKRPYGFNLGEFLAGDQFHGSGKLYLFFHAIEWVVIMWAVLLAMRFGWIRLKKDSFKVVLLVLSFSLFFHLCFDIVHNGTTFRTYWITNRAVHDFDLKNYSFEGL